MKIRRQQNLRRKLLQLEAVTTALRSMLAMEVREVGYGDVVNRLNTFNTWPSEAPSFIKELVEAGFIYTGVKDRVVCFSCNLEREGWRDDEEPLVFHKKASSCCDYIGERDRNHKIEQETTKLSPQTESQDAVRIVKSMSFSDQLPDTGMGIEAVNMAENSLHGSSQDSFDLYEERLKSFGSWPPDAPDYIKDLVEAGFYYSGAGDTVCCFCCDLTLNDWNEYECPFLKHKKFNPDCPHVTKYLLESKMPSQERSQTISGREDRKSNKDTTMISSDTSTPDFNKPSNKIDHGTDNAQSSPDAPSVRLKDELVDMCKLEDRLKSFRTYPLKNSTVAYSDFAHAGFFSVGNGIEVCCFACNLLLHECSDVFELDRMHKKQSPNCPFVQGALRTNVPAQCEDYSGFVRTLRLMKEKEMCFFQKIGDSIKGAFSSGSVDEEEPNAEPSSSSTQSPSPNHLEVGDNPKTLIRQRSNPTNRDFKSLTSRLQTFVSFPPNAVVQPSDLAAAGFIYTGMDDGVKCYSCSVTLKNWEEGDTPWGEHIKWSPQCRLVNERQETSMAHDDMTGTSTPSNMAPDGNMPPSIDVSYNDDSMLSLPDATDRFSITDQAAMPSIPITNDVNNSKISHTVQDSSSGEAACPRKESKIQESDYTQLLDMGFSRDVINTVQDIYLRLFGSLFLSADELAQAILYYQEFGSLNGCRTGTPMLDDSTTGQARHRDKMTSGDKDNDGSATGAIHNSDNLYTPDDQDHSLVHAPIDLHNELRRVKEMQLCKICMDSEVGIVFIPCGHLITCPKCANDVKLCPMCRAPINSIVRTYMS